MDVKDLARPGGSRVGPDVPARQRALAHDEGQAFAAAADGQAGGVAGLAAGGNLLEVGGATDRATGELDDGVANGQPGPVGDRALADGSDVRTRTVFRVGDLQAQTWSAAVPRGHALQPRHVEADDGFLLIGDHRHAHLPRALDHLARRVLVDRDVADLEWHAFFAKELLRSNAPGSSRSGVNGYRGGQRHTSSGTSLASAKALAAAFKVASMSASAWASDMKPASNCDGAK